MKLTIQNITKHYGANLALDNFSASFEPGIYALLGPNGSGKSTLMNIITDNLKADSGSITYTSDEGASEYVLKMGVRFRGRKRICRKLQGHDLDFIADGCSGGGMGVCEIHAVRGGSESRRTYKQRDPPSEICFAERRRRTHGRMVLPRGIKLAGRQRHGRDPRFRG